MPTQEEIFEKVRTTLVDALNVDEGEVTMKSRLRADLNAESIDFLDIVFRLEKQFGIKIPREELFPESIFQGDPKFVTDGKVNAEGMKELREKMPYADLSEFQKDPRLEKMEDLFTVELIVRYLESKLAR
jgi:acyl carrier protein